MSNFLCLEDDACCSMPDAPCSLDNACLVQVLWHAAGIESEIYIPILATCFFPLCHPQCAIAGSRLVIVSFCHVSRYCLVHLSTH